MPTVSATIIDITTMGADPSGVQDSRKAIQDTIDALGMTGPGGGTVLIPAGTFKIGLDDNNNCLTTNGHNIHFQGLGRYISVLKTVSGTVDAIRHPGGGPVIVSDLSFDTFNPRTGGAYLTIDPPTGQNLSSIIRDVTMNAPFIGVDFVRCAYFTIQDVHFPGQAGMYAGVRIQNMTDFDSGDSTISGCNFSGPSGHGILQHSSGGLKVYGCKFLAMQYGLALSLKAMVQTQVLLINGNSFENQSESSIVVGALSTDGSFPYIVIDGNELSSNGRGIEIVDNGATFYDVIISNNVISVPPDQYGVLLNGGNTVSIADNVFTGTGGGTRQAIVVLSPSVHPEIGANLYRGYAAGTTVVDSSNRATVLSKITNQSGSVTTSTASGPFYYSTASVTFPTGAYTAVPQVFGSCASPGLFASVDAVTMTGCTVRVFSLTSGATVPFSVSSQGT